MAESQVIHAIREKVDRLVADNRRIRGENDKLAARNEKLKAQNGDLSSRIAELEKRIQVLELREAVSGQSEDMKIARARINRLMREVDKCIALLNR